MQPVLIHLKLELEYVFTSTNKLLPQTFQIILLTTKSVSILQEMPKIAV